MAKTEKVAVTVDRELLRAAEELRRRTRESRSGLFSRALRRLLEEEIKRRACARYVEVYREHPETPADVDWVAEHSRAALASVPWEDDSE